VIDLSRISNSSLAGRILRAPLRLVPRGLVVPVVQGPLRGVRWVVGSSTHGCWLGCYEAANQAICVRLVRHGMTVYDLGAHVGFYTLLFSRLVGPAGVVQAFEPVVRNISYLERHLRLNGTVNVHIQELAVTRETGTVSFDCSSGVSTGRVVPGTASETSRVPAVSLDDFIYARGHEAPDLIKMDVEGGEVDVLAGMSRLLAERLPVLLISVHGSTRWRECIVALESAGYTLLDSHGMPARVDKARDDLVALPRDVAGEAPERGR
jgi:FkbM family methyltransferase